MTSEPIDLLIDDARFILSQDADRTLLERASIAVKGNRIVAVGDAGELRRNSVPLACHSRLILKLKRKWEGEA